MRRNTRHTGAPRFRRAMAMLVAMCIALPAGAQGLVLCFCHDGKVKLEAACNPAQCCPPADCESEPCGDQETPESACSMGDAHHDCTDIPLPVGDEVVLALTPQLRPDVPTPGGHDSVSHPMPHRSVPCVTSPVNPHFTAAASPPLLPSLRTTVLLL